MRNAQLFSVIRHFSAILSLFCVHLSQTNAEYPRYLEG